MSTLHTFIPCIGESCNKSGWPLPLCYVLSAPLPRSSPLPVTQVLLECGPCQTIGTGFQYFVYTATKRRTVEEVAVNQQRDYTFSSLYSSQPALTCLDYDKDNNFLCNIGDVYGVEM